MSSFKEGTLAARWRKNHDGCGPDLVFYYPRRCDGHLLHCFFSYAKIGDSNIMEELEKRGYDLETLQFTIRKKV